MTRLTDPVFLAGRSAPSRVVFGAHETNLGQDRALTGHHAAYYAERAAGGAGVVVTETASVTADDWPYERAPLAERCEAGWAAVADACRPYGTLVLAGLGHAGGQGASAHSQSVLWAPSPVADVVSREMPAEMEQPQIDAVVAGFADAARRAVLAGLDGVEVDAGAYALLRQFHSGLTNQRGDAYGTDRLRLTREVLTEVREVIGAGRVLALRLSCDELAPWAGVTPQHAAGQVEALADLLDLLVVVRGGPYSVSAYRPDGHTAPQFNLELCREMRKAARGRVPVVLQGSVVDTAAAQGALDGGAADLVEMTRAQIAEPRLVRLLREGTPERVRPCVLCNQACSVRDNRNPRVSCIGNPRSGHETRDEPVDADDGAGRRDSVGRPADGAAERQVLVVGAGPAGLECARVLASRGHRVRLAEQADAPGGTLRAAAVGGPARERLALLADWLESECRRLGVGIRTGTTVTEDGLDAAAAAGQRIVLATGSRPAPARRPADPVPPAGTGPDTPASGPAAPGTREGAPPVMDVLDVLRRGPDALAPGPVLVHDPVGGPVAVAAAEWLAAAGRTVHLVTPDQVAGVQLARSGDLADANARLQRAGVRREPRSLLRGLRSGNAVLEDVWTGARRELPCAAVVDCGHRLPQESLYLARPGTARAGDCVAPRTVLEAVLEGRRLALAVDAEPPGADPGTGPLRHGAPV